MKRFILPIAIATALLGAVLACAGVQEEVVDPFWEVRTDAGLGSGTVVKIDGEVLVLTAAHVVKDARGAGSAIHIRRETGDITTTIRCEVAAYSGPEEDGGCDLCLLKPLDARGLTPAALGLGQRLSVGQDVWYVGSPGGVHCSLERTIVNKLAHQFPQTGAAKFFVVNGNGWYGSSGGGVYVKNGDGKLVLVGVVTRALTDGPKTPVGCERPETVKKFLDKYAADKQEGDE